MHKKPQRYASLRCRSDGCIWCCFACTETNNSFSQQLLPMSVYLAMSLLISSALFLLWLCVFVLVFIYF